MKMNELKDLELKDLLEKVENAEEKLQQMKLNHSIAPLENPSQIKRENLTNNNGPDGNKKFKKNKTGCRDQQQNG